MNNLQVKFVKCHPDAKIPHRAYEGDCGWDLFSTEYITILPFGYALISTGIKLQMPKGVYGRISSRSGLAVKHGIEVGAGIIDEGYTNEIKVLLRNFNFNLQSLVDYLQPNAYNSLFGFKQTYVVKPGDKIAQIIFSPYFAPKLVEVNELEETERDTKGFGSSNLL